MDTVNLLAIWEVFIKFVWPLVLAYGAYLHRQLANLMAKFEELKESHYEFKANVSRDYATHKNVAELENRLTAVLNRIDDKVTRILEHKRNG
jgi:hypothetical protein